MKSMSQTLANPVTRATLSLALVYVVGAFLSPHMVNVSVLLGIAPFVSVLGISAVGQHLVVQQRGFDLSVAGVMSFAAVVATVPWSSNPGGALTLSAALAAVAAGAAAGLINGMTVTYARVTPLVSSIGVNAVLFGFTLLVSNGVPSTAPTALVDFCKASLLGLPVVFVMVLALTGASAVALGKTALGWRFIAAGVNPRAAAVFGIRVPGIIVATYMLAGALFAAAGVLLAGILVTPSVFSGSPYMLTTIAAVVIGGSPLNGGKGSVVATFIGALFLSYLDQLVLSLGFEASMQGVVQAAIIFAGVILPKLGARFAKG